MASEYYKPCKELEQCEALDQYWEKKQFDKFFEEYLKIAEETSYPLAQCQVGFCYLEGIGVERNFEKHSIGVYWQQNREIGMHSTIWQVCMKKVCM